MDAILVILVFVGSAVSLVGSLMIVIEAFRRSILWGLAYCVVPFAGIVFIIKYWDSARRGFLTALAGSATMIVSFAILALIVHSKPADAGLPAAAASQPPAQLASATPARPAVWNEPDPSPSFLLTASPAVPADAEDARKPLPRLGRAGGDEPVKEKSAAVTRPERGIEKVWADRDSRLYYSDACKERPERVVRLAKSVAVLQGFTPASCD